MPVPSGPAPVPGLPGAAALNSVLERYKEPDLRRSLWQLLDTAVPFFCLWALMLRSLEFGYWATLLLALPAAGLLMRLFIIQHDCGHGSFFRSARANDALGRVLGVLTLTPYRYWRKSHAVHHASAGNLDRRGWGDITTLTVREYLGLSAWGRLRYRFYRSPALLFGPGAAFHFLVLHRLPGMAPAGWRRERLSILGTDLALAGVLAAASWTIGLGTFLKVQLPVTALASSLGVWFFYVQHQFEGAYWEREASWDFISAGLRGGSYYKLPRVLQWLTGNIGFHHVHHLSSRIPNYRLESCVRENPVLERVPALTLRSSLRCAFLRLWDEEGGRLVGYAGIKPRLLAAGLRADMERVERRLAVAGASERMWEKVRFRLEAGKARLEAAMARYHAAGLEYRRWKDRWPAEARREWAARLDGCKAELREAKARWRGLLRSMHRLPQPSARGLLTFTAILDLFRGRFHA